MNKKFKTNESWKQCEVSGKPVAPYCGFYIKAENEEIFVHPDEVEEGDERVEVLSDDFGDEIEINEN